MEAKKENFIKINDDWGVGSDELNVILLKSHINKVTNERVWVRKAFFNSYRQALEHMVERGVKQIDDVQKIVNKIDEIKEIIGKALPGIQRIDKQDCPSVYTGGTNNK